MAQAIFAGGCFWCTEAVFRDVIGVSEVESGYIGGTVPDPTYKQVCSGLTGHAEAIRITYDPDQLSYADLADIFMVTHDPTQLNRQGNDVGTQYRSALFVEDEAQERTARASLERYQAGAQLAAESFVDVCVTEEELDRIAIRLRLRDDASVHCNFFGRGPSWPLAFLYPIEKRLCDLLGRV